MTLKTNKEPAVLKFEHALGQLRHAFALLVAADDKSWTPEMRTKFADGLLAKSIADLERLSHEFAERGSALVDAYTANARYKRRFRETEDVLLANANNIASASQARRIIVSVFRRLEGKDKDA